MKIIKIRNGNFYKKVTELIAFYLKKKKRIEINFFLTGGKTAKKLYKYLALCFINEEKQKHFFQTDEKISNIKNNLNYTLIKNKILKKIPIKSYKFWKLSLKKNLIKNKNQYYKAYKKNNYILLTIGDDGHFASLSKTDNENSIYTNKILCKTKYQSKNYNRISIGPRFFLNKKNTTFILCPGNKKKEMFKIIKNNDKYYRRVNLLLKNGIFFYN